MPELNAGQAKRLTVPPVLADPPAPAWKKYATLRAILARRNWELRTIPNDGARGDTYLVSRLGRCLELADIAAVERFTDRAIGVGE